MKFDIVVGNPPFQDSKNRKKTQHKIWKEFTEKAFEEWLAEDGIIAWVTPQSWGSPSNSILELFKNNNLLKVNLNTGKYFPDIGSTFSDYLIQKSKKGSKKTNFTTITEQSFDYEVSSELLYFPNDFCEEAINIHQKVMFAAGNKQLINYDYVTCHNVIRHAHKLNDKKIEKAKEDLVKETCEDKRLKIKNRIKALEEKAKNIVITISEKETNSHIYPVFHTNNKIWYSSIKQSFADSKKVMWSRSGYTKPFFDNGTMGCTDMGYYILVDNQKAGERLSKFLNSKLMSYIFKTAKWSGFGNEIVFSNIPVVPLDKDLTEQDYYNLFSLTDKEIKYIEDSHKNLNRKKRKKSEIRNKKRVKEFGEVFTPPDLVSKMMASIPKNIWEDKTRTFLDPACGNGNFLVSVLENKMNHGVSALDSIGALYGVDIMEDNIHETRKRLREKLSGLIEEEKLEQILNKNFIVKNSLKYNMEFD